MENAILKPLIVCGVTQKASEAATEINEPCNFDHFMILVQNLIHNMIVLSTFLATAAFIYIGYLLITSGGNTTKRTEAKRIALMVLKGYLWILGAWLLVYTITSVLLKPGFVLLQSPL